MKLNDKGFLSRDITVLDLVLNRTDVHHVFPRKYLKSQGLARGKYNQIANYALMQSEINIAIGSKPPAIYFAELQEQCQWLSQIRRYCDRDELLENLREHCIPLGIFDSLADDYDSFLIERRKLMAAKMRKYFAKL